MRHALASRQLADGSGTVITLYRETTTRELTVEAVNRNGTSEKTAEPSEALWMYNHPFSRKDWLDYPGINAAPASEVVAGAELALAHSAEYYAD